VVESTRVRHKLGELTISDSGQQHETQSTPIPDNVNYRRHRGACRFYRENWSIDDDPNGSREQMLYQIICLMDTPPLTDEEQERCMHSVCRCWREKFANRQNGHNGHDEQTVQEKASDNERANGKPRRPVVA
jgi:hypothetical protein